MKVAEQLTAEQRSFRARMALLPGSASLIAFAYACLALLHAPATGNLYAVLYPNAGRHQAEDRWVFLFAFPLMLALGAAINIGIARRGQRVRDTLFNPSDRGSIFITLLWVAFFFFGSLHRSWLALHHGW